MTTPTTTNRTTPTTEVRRPSTETEPLRRDAKITVREPADEDGRTTYEISFASDYPVKRWGWTEILDISGADLGRMNDGAAVLLNHTGMEDWGGQVGVVERAWRHGNKLRAEIRFSKAQRAQEIEADVADDIRRNVSVGYRVQTWEINEAERTEIAREWTPVEVSFVGVGADPTVGVGRSEHLSPRDPVIVSRVSAETTAHREPPMADPVPNSDDGTRTDPTPAPPPAPAAINLDEVRGAERQRIRTIEQLGRRFGQSELADTAITDGHDLERFNADLLGALEADSADVTPTGRTAATERALVREGRLAERDTARDGTFLTPDERQQFSFCRLLRAIDPQASRADEEAGRFELEVCAESQRRSRAVTVEGPNARDHGPGSVPYEVLAHRSIDALADRTRVQSVGTDTVGGHLVDSILMVGSFIDNLRNTSSFLPRVMMMTGLVGNLDIPYKSASTTGGWIGEDGDAASTDITVGVYALTPHTYAAQNIMTRRSLQQTTPGIEMLVRADLARTHAIAVDKAIPHGSGAANQPTGIAAVTGIGSTMLAHDARPTYANVIGMEQSVELGNALMGDLAFIVNPRFKNSLRQTQRFTDSQLPIWTDDNTLLSHPGASSNQVNTTGGTDQHGDAFFGNWMDVVAASWATLDLIVDPYSGSTKGRLKIVSFCDWDFLLRHPASMHYLRGQA